jgi:hypothetical protein
MEQGKEYWARNKELGIIVVPGFGVVGGDNSIEYRTRNKECRRKKVSILHHS